MTHVALGLDIGGTKARAVAMSPDGEIRADIEAPTRRGLPALVAVLTDVRDRLQDRLGGSEIRSIGVGVPGIVDPESGLVRAAANMDLHDVLLGEELASVFGMPVAVDNDVSAAALGAWDWAGRPQSLALLSLGTGLGVGVVVDGRVFRGSRGLAGELGHLPVEDEGPMCRCGQRGCLELYLSGSALARLWPVAEGHSGAALVRSATAGDPRAALVFEAYVRRLAWALQQLALSFDPECIVIGGGISALGDALLRPVRERLASSARASSFLESSALAPRVRMLPAGHPSAAVGAAVFGAQTALALR